MRGLGPSAVQSGNRLHRSKVEVYLHLVWATLRREPLLTPTIEAKVHGCIVNEAERLKCTVLAIGGTEDHVHLALMLPSSVSIAQLVQQVKGVSSKLANELQAQPNIGVSHYFKWQEGYAALSVSRPHVAKVTGYVQNQKQHHMVNTTWGQLEMTEETVDRLPVREDGLSSE